MIRRIIYRLLEGRHYWRYVSFSEIAELYASRALRLMAVSMVSIFVAIYLYQNGYHLTFIMVYFTCYFLLRALVGVPLGYFVARFGPKHGALLSNFLYVPALLVLALLPDYGVWALAAYGTLQAVSVTLYDICYLVNFSKVKSDEHAGKELGYMVMIERGVTSLSPAVGGFVAFLFGPQATLIMAAILFACAAGPLFFSAEPVKTRQLITFAGLPWRRIRRNLVTATAIGVDSMASGPLWALFVAIIVFGTTSDVVYAELGALATITMIAALIVSRVYGLLIDRRRARELLDIGVMGDMTVHFLRPFVSTPLGVLLINVVNESATTAYAMPYQKALFDMADSLPGYRIVYMTITAIFTALGAAILASVTWMLSLFFSEVVAMQITYVVTATCVLAIMMHGFPALARRR